jgi:type II secretory pathway pseudopilin PulG
MNTTTHIFFAEQGRLPSPAGSRSSWWLLLCVLQVGLLSGSLVASDAPPITAAVEPGAESAVGSDLRQALAHTVIERNRINQQFESAQNQRWLILGYAALVTLLAAWLVRLRLIQGQEHPEAVVTEETPPGRANAVITVRNSETQREVVTGRVTTRHRFGQQTTRMMPVTTRAVPRATTPAKPATAATAAKISTLVAQRIVQSTPPATPVAATTSVMRRTTTSEYTPTDAANDKAKTGTARPMIVEEFSDLDALAETPVEDGAHTRQMRRNQTITRSGLSLLEIIIALSILATVLASVSGGIFVLTNSKQAVNEDLAVSDLMRLWSERLMGADWDWLGRQRFDDTMQGAWSWQRPEVEAAALLPGDYPPLSENAPISTNNAATLLLSGSASGVNDLKLFLEYYRPAVMDACLVTPAGTTADHWALNRGAYRLAPPIDLRQQPSQAVVIRIVAHWRTLGGGKRQSELLFARRK